MHAPPPSPPAENQPAQGGPKTWRVGTLAYTKAGLIVLFFVLLGGDFAWSLRDRSVGPMSQWFLKSLEVPNWLYALILSSFPAALGLLIGPIVSYKSDRHRGRRGRRIPFLLVTTPLAAVGMIGIGLCPVAGPALHHLLGLQIWSERTTTVILFGVFWTAFEFALVVGQSVFGGLVNDVVPRPLIGRFFGMFRAVSLLDGILFNYWLIGKAETSFTLIMVAIGVTYGVGVTWMCLKVREGDYPPPPPPEPARPGPLGAFGGAAGTYIKECFGHRYYVWVFVTITAASICFAPVSLFSLPFAKSLGMDMAAYGKCVALTYTISLAISFLVGWLADLFHPLRVSMAALGAYVAVALWGFFQARTPETFSVALVLHGVISGCYFTGAASLGQRLYPRGRFAQFASAAALLTATLNMVAGPVVGSFIDLSSGRYHIVFAVSATLALLALGAARLVYGRFVAFGGPDAYQAPEYKSGPDGR